MEYPVLDTGVQVQNSASRRQQVQSRSYRFTGTGYQSQQADINTGLTWRLYYEALSPEEAARLREFYESHGRAQTFTFQDPWSGEEVPACRFSRRGMLMVMNPSGRFEMQVEIEYAKQ
jgi:phage-related protein